MTFPNLPADALAAMTQQQAAPELPEEFAHADGDVIIRRLSKAQASTPAVKARVDQWGARMVNRTTALGTAAGVAARIAELEAERESVGAWLDAAPQIIEPEEGVDLTDEGRVRAAELREKAAEHARFAERAVQIESELVQHRERHARILAEGEPFEILVPVDLLGEIRPHRIAIQNGFDTEYGAIIDSIEGGVARSLRPANEYHDLAHIKFPATVALRAPGARQATAKKTLRIS